MKRIHSEHDPASCRATLLLALSLSMAGCSPGDSRTSEVHAEQAADEHDEHSDERSDDQSGAQQEGIVELTEAQLASAGVRVERAAPGEIPNHLTLPAVVAENADAITHVNPRAPGIVRSIHKQLGEEVREGDLLCVIDSVELGSAVAGYVRTRAMVDAGETTLQRERELFEERLATAERVLEGAIEIDRRIRGREEELQEKAVSTIRPLLEADRALQNSELDKERQLTELRAERDSRLLALEIELRERRILAESARNQLLALGIEAPALDGLASESPLLAGTYQIRAPRGGIVSGRHISTGEYVDAETKLYTVEDLSRVWIVASAFEGQVRSVRTGQHARIRLDAFPESVFDGQVTLVGYEVDRESRALGVRIELDNPELADWPEEFPIRPGMFGRVDLVVERTNAHVVLPESALVHDDEGEFVFVQVSAGTFERRAVQLGATSSELVEVREGVEPGEQVAVTGTFQLKSILRKGELGEGHGH